MDDTPNKQVNLGLVGQAMLGVRRTGWAVVSTRALVAGCAVAVNAWARSPWPGAVALGLLVATRPNLDGAHEKFVDLVHLTQEGRQQLAETFFAGVKTVLDDHLPRLDRSGPLP